MSNQEELTRFIAFPFVLAWLALDVALLALVYTAIACQRQREGDTFHPDVPSSTGGHH